MLQKERDGFSKHSIDIFDIDNLISLKLVLLNPFESISLIELFNKFIDFNLNKPLNEFEFILVILFDFKFKIDKFKNRVEYFIEEQQKYNDQIANHTHISPFNGKPTLPSPSLVIANMSLTFNKIINVTIPYYFQKWPNCKL